jgi:hypothetical protein
MAQQRVMIDSRDRIAGSSIQCATYVLDKPIQNVSCLRLDFAMLFNTFYNIDYSHDKLLIDNTIQVIPSGFYTDAELAITIDTILKQVDPTMSVNYSSITGGCTWNMGAHTLGVSSSARHLVGINESKTGVFQSVFNISMPQSVHIFSPQFSGLDSQRSTNRNLIDQSPIAIIPIYAAHDELNFYQPTFPGIISIQSTSIQRFTLQLKDSQGDDLVNGTDYQLHLTFF